MLTLSYFLHLFPARPLQLSALELLISGSEDKQVCGTLSPKSSNPARPCPSCSQVGIPQSIPTGEPGTGTNHLSVPPSHAAGTAGTSQHSNTRAPPANFISTQTQATVAEICSHRCQWHSSQHLSTSRQLIGLDIPKYKSFQLLLCHQSAFQGSSQIALLQLNHT